MTTIYVLMTIILVILLGLSICMYTISKHVGEFLNNINAASSPASSGPLVGTDAEKLLSTFPHKSSRYKVLLIMSTDCHACLELAQTLRAFTRDEVVDVFALIGVEGNRREVVDFVHAANIPVHMSDLSVITQELDVREYPMVILISPTNQVAAKFIATFNVVRNLLSAPEKYANVG
jgi:hypothetical protein